MASTYRTCVSFINVLYRLVELVVLNIGLQAGILTIQVFSMFVLDALFLTFCTTPVVSILYPPHRRIHVTISGNEIRETLDTGKHGGGAKEGHDYDVSFTHKTRFTVLLDTFDHLPGVMSLSQLLSLSSNLSNRTSNTSSVSDADSIPKEKEKLIMTQPVSVTALRLLELTDRTSALMKSSRVEAI